MTTRVPLHDELPPPAGLVIDVAAERRQARKERLRLLLRRPSFIIGAFILLVWVVCAVFGSAISFSLYFWLLSHFSATRLSLIGYTVPVVAMVVGAGFLDEPFTLKALAGSGLVLVGVALAAQARKSV